MLNRLRRRFTAVFMILVAGMLCLIFGLVYRFTQLDLIAESINMMHAVASIPIRHDRPGEQPERIRLPYFILHVDRQGDFFATGGEYYDLSDRSFLAELLEAADASGKEVDTLPAYHLRFCRIRTPMGEQVVFADTTNERAILRSLAGRCAAIGALCLLIFWGISVLLARWMVRPAETAWKQQRQFVADASHELKTPLTVIMTSAELLQSADSALDNRAQMTENILTMTRQMRGLVERLLELARSDQEQGDLVLEPVDFSAVAEEAVLVFEPVFFERGLSLDSRVQEGLTVNAEPRRLAQVLHILLDNALKYAASSGVVRLELARVNRRRCLLSVTNPGPTLSGAELKQIFKRFCRLDPARSRDGGYGLGLSIAEGIVQAHHGRIWAESAKETVTFFVELPLKGVVGDAERSVTDG